MRRKLETLVFLIWALLLAGSYAAAQSFNYVSIDIPNAIAPNSQGTWASGINPRGQIVGGYLDQNGLEHGYFYSDGNFTTIDVPGSLAGLPDTTKLETEVNGINPQGEMVGDYFAPPGAPGAPACVVAYSPECDRGFLYKDGHFYNVLASGHLGSIPNSITSAGAIYGCVHDHDFDASMFGFSRNSSGEFTILWFSPSMSNGATPDGETIVGLYVPSGAVRPHGFVIHDGLVNDYLFPGGLSTEIWGINPQGDFVGVYRDPAGLHGFLQPGDGSAPVALNVPEATLTWATAVNQGGAIVGFYVDVNGGQHGFLTVHASN